MSNAWRRSRDSLTQLFIIFSVLRCPFVLAEETSGTLGTVRASLLTIFIRAFMTSPQCLSGVDLFRPMKRSTHFKHNDPCNCAYLNYLFGFIGNTCTSSITEEIDDMSGGENLITLECRFGGGDITTLRRSDDRTAFGSSALSVSRSAMDTDTATARLFDSRKD